MASTTLGNEELVGFLLTHFFTSLVRFLYYIKLVFLLLCALCRRAMFIKRPCRLWSTPSPPLPLTILRCGQPPPPPTVMNVRGCCGASPAKACAALSVASNATKSVRICSMQTVCRVRKHKNIITHCKIEDTPIFTQVYTYTPSPPHKPNLFCPSSVSFCHIDIPLFLSSIHSHILLPLPFQFISWVMSCHTPASCLALPTIAFASILFCPNLAPQGVSYPIPYSFWSQSMQCIIHHSLSPKSVVRSWCQNICWSFTLYLVFPSQISS